MLSVYICDIAKHSSEIHFIRYTPRCHTKDVDVAGTVTKALPCTCDMRASKHD